MERLNIIYENLCIKQIIRVIKNHNSKHHKLLTVNGRYSDAFVYVLSGSCTYRFSEGIEYTVNAGDVFYLPYQSVYTMYIHTEDYRFIFCDFEFSQSPTVSVLFQTLKNIDILFLKLLNVFRSSIKSKYTLCMSVLYNIYNVLQQSSAPAYLSNDKKNIIADTKRFMEENFSNTSLDISTLANQMEISEVYFRKLFKSQYNISPLKYLNSLRLKNAMALMKHPFLSLEECARQSGFSSLQYFCRLFKKELGISPGKYRKKGRICGI